MSIHYFYQMHFSEIVGQKNLKERLIHAVKAGRISHAQLFLGKSGYGGLPLALAYAQYINCNNKQQNDSCGSCNSCLKMSKLAHPDLHFVFPVSTNKEVRTKAVSDNFLQAWREINHEFPYFNLDDWHKKIEIEQKQSIIGVQESQSIIKKLSLKPYEAEYKFLILFKPENMNVQASNKLLKLIEEPTDKTVLILVAEEQERLLSTITSRTQLIKIPPISEQMIGKHLVETKEVDTGLAQQSSKFAEGDLREALIQLDRNEEKEQFFELFKNWMRSCYEANVDKMYVWVEEVSSRSFGREKQKRFLEYALSVMREGMIRNYADDRLQRFKGKEEGFMKNFAPFVHGKNVIAIVELLDEAHSHIARNAYAKILLMDMSMRFANLLRVKK